MLKVIEVKTSLGIIIAEKSTDPNHPGIWMSLIHPDGYHISLAGVEEDMNPLADEPVLRTIVWGDIEKEDPTNVIEHKVGKIVSDGGDVTW